MSILYVAVGAGLFVTLDAYTLYANVDMYGVCLLFSVTRFSVHPTNFITVTLSKTRYSTVAEWRIRQEVHRLIGYKVIQMVYRVCQSAVIEIRPSPIKDR